MNIKLHGQQAAIDIFMAICVPLLGWYGWYLSKLGQGHGIQSFHERKAS